MPAMIYGVIVRITKEDIIRPSFVTVCYRGAVLWNWVSEYLNDSCDFKQF